MKTAYETIPLPLFVSLFLVFFCGISFAGEFAVSPMMIELRSESRTIQKFHFRLFGKSNTRVKLELFDMNQMPSGYMEFTPSTIDNPESIASWITLDDNHYRLREGQSVEVRGQIRIPAKSSGTHLIAIMVEEDLPPQDKGGIAIKIRYAVILNLLIEGRRQRIRTEFENLAVIVKEDGAYIEGIFTSRSTMDEWLYSQVQLRDENNRLIERIALKSESAWQRHDAGSRIFPGAQVRVYGKITKPHSAGVYNVLVRNTFANKSQPVLRQELILTGQNPDRQQAFSATNDEQAKGAPGAEITINPSTVVVKIRDNGTSFTSLRISNDKNLTVRISLPTELEDMESLGISEFTFFPSSLVLRARQKSKVVLKQSHIDGASYGDIAFVATIESVSGSTDNVNKDSVLLIKTLVE